MNWLAKARTAAGKSKSDCAAALGMTVEDYAHAERHPGALTLNEVGTLGRLFGEGVARGMLAHIAEVYA